jgi:hypothetical protein
MDTFNAIASKRETAFAEAIFVLHTLSEAPSVSILDYLLENGEATLLDLIITTGMDADTLDGQLDLLCQTKVVQLHSNLYSNWYQIDYQRLERVSLVAGQLASGK